MPDIGHLAFAGRGRRQIGLLGGSFNPAHDGHLHISDQALRRLGLAEIWWLVSPQNPLKSGRDMSPFHVRLRQAARVASPNRRIRVTGIEAELGTRYTADTLQALRRRFATTRFVWLMGADNLIQLPGWDRWPSIMETVPVAVLDRPTYSFRALAGAAARRFARYRLPVGRARELPARRPPAWVFVSGPRHAASATAIRSARSGGPAGSGNEGNDERSAP